MSDTVNDSTPPTLDADLIDDKGKDKPAKHPGGRPPGSGTKSPAGAGRPTTAQRTVEEALSSLDGLYTMIGYALEFLAPETYSKVYAPTLPSLREKNRTNLTAAPKLAASIASWGNKGGTAGFIAANALAFAPVASMAFMEVRIKVMAAQAEAHANQE